MEDLLYKFLGAYKKSPKWVKAVAGTLYGALPYSFRYGRTYNEFKELIHRSRGWSQLEHRAYQTGKVKDLIAYAYENVPYYRSKYEQAGVGPQDFIVLEDLCKFPFIEREEIQRHREELVASSISQNQLLYTATSGSSGVPLELYHHKGITRAKERAFLQDMWEEFDCRIADKKVIFRGEVIGNQEEPWYYDPVDRHLIMSSYLLSAETLPAYCSKVREVAPAVLRGYPFTLFKLTQLMHDAGEKPFPLKTIILESENIYTAHMEYMKQFFQCSVCHYYGHTERLVFGGNCKESEAYHIHPQYGMLEVIAEDGSWAGEGEEGEIVATGFDNMVMPFIRYKTGDLAIRGGDSCTCGRQFPMLQKVMGRAEEYVLLNNGKKIPFHNLLAGIHGKSWGYASKLQCCQTVPGKMDLNIMPAPGVTPEEVTAVFLKEIELRSDQEQLKVTVNFVEDIAKTKSGKTKLFIQRIGE